jgi:hypothetical protein
LKPKLPTSRPILSPGSPAQAERQRLEQLMIIFSHVLKVLAAILGLGLCASPFLLYFRHLLFSPFEVVGYVLYGVVCLVPRKVVAAGRDRVIAFFLCAAIGILLQFCKPRGYHPPSFQPSLVPVFLAGLFLYASPLLSLILYMQVSRKNRVKTFKNPEEE